MKKSYFVTRATLATLVIFLLSCFGCSEQGTEPIPTYAVSSAIDKSGYSRSKILSLRYSGDGTIFNGQLDKVKEGQVIIATVMENDITADTTLTTFDFTGSSAPNTSNRKGMFSFKAGKGEVSIKVKASDITATMVTEMNSAMWYFIDRSTGKLTYRFRAINTAGGSPLTYASAAWFNKSTGRFCFVSSSRACSLPTPLPAPDSDGYNWYDAIIDNNFSGAFTGLGGSAPTIDGARTAFISKASVGSTIGILELNSTGQAVPNSFGNPLNVISLPTPSNGLKLITEPLGLASGLNSDEFIAGDNATSTIGVSVHSLKASATGYVITKNDTYVINGVTNPFNYTQLRSILKSSDGKHYFILLTTGPSGEWQHFGWLDHSQKIAKVITPMPDNGLYSALVEVPLHAVK